MGWCLQKASQVRMTAKTVSNSPPTTSTPFFSVWASSLSMRMVLRMAMLAMLFFTTVYTERCFKEVSEPLQEDCCHEKILQTNATRIRDFFLLIWRETQLRQFECKIEADENRTELPCAAIRITDVLMRIRIRIVITKTIQRIMIVIPREKMLKHKHTLIYGRVSYPK